MRADQYLANYGWTKSRSHASVLINQGFVSIDGEKIRKAGVEIDDSVPHRVDIREYVPYVSRGGCKLAGALDAFNIDVNGFLALDIGASTGGFTDCLLQRGAREVYAVDAGIGQLDKSLRDDVRVHCIEKCNARYLTPEMLGKDFLTQNGADIIVMDVSFISQTCILPVFPSLLKQDGVAVTLIKPQFEVGKAHIGKGGIVKEPMYRAQAAEKVLLAARAVGLYPRGLVRSSIEGGDGNVELLACFSKKDFGWSDIQLLSEHLFV